jgi:hypothetical protein
VRIGGGWNSIVFSGGVESLGPVTACHRDMARPQVADGRDGLGIRRVAANMLNIQLRTWGSARSSRWER